MKFARKSLIASLGLIFWTHIGYGVFLAVLRRLRGPVSVGSGANSDQPFVSLIVAAYREEDVIVTKVRNALELDWQRDRLEIIVAVDGGADADSDATAQRARDAGADLVLELPRGGKIRAQDAAVARSKGEILAFSDANATWEQNALVELVQAFSDKGVGYVCGHVDFVNEDGDNQEGLYWRYDMWLRKHESELESVTAGNGAIYAVRRSAYINVDPIMGHDLSLPFNLVKRGWRAVYAPSARATEKMVPTIEGEWQRKRRMMSHTWPIVFRGGLLSPRGYSPLYALMIFSHRVLRYATPFLHIVAAITSLRLALKRNPLGALATIAHAAIALAAFTAPVTRLKPFTIARYYILTTAAIAAGCWDWLRHGTTAGWEQSDGTR